MRTKISIVFFRVRRWLRLKLTGQYTPDRLGVPSQRPDRFMLAEDRRTP